MFINMYVRGGGGAFIDKCPAKIQCQTTYFC